AALAQLAGEGVRQGGFAAAAGPADADEQHDNAPPSTTLLPTKIQHPARSVKAKCAQIRRDGSGSDASTTCHGQSARMYAIIMANEFSEVKAR
ncbi:MAG: hypothetical protein ACI4O7_03430, partial [Aristaeellaceae bacterium]